MWGMSGARRLRRGWITLLAQGGSALVNLVATVAAARSGGVAGFGGFAIALGFYMIILGISRSCCTEPLLVARSNSDRELAQRPSLRLALALGVVAALGLICAAALLPNNVAESLRGLAAVLPILLFHDAVRGITFAHRAPAPAAGMVLTWLALEVLFLGLLQRSGAMNPGTVLVVWGAAGLAPALWVYSRLPRPQAEPPSTMSWLRNTASVSRPQVADFLVGSGTGQVALMALPAIGGLEPAAAIRGALTLFGPLSVVQQAVPFTLIPYIAGLARSAGEHDQARQYENAPRIAACLALMTCLYGVAVLLVPDSLGRQVLGDSWGPARAAVAPWTIAAAAFGAGVVLTAVLRAHTRVGRVLRVRLFVAPLIIGAPLGGFAILGTSGFAFGMGLANLVMVVALMRLVVRATLDSKRSISVR